MSLLAFLGIAAARAVDIGANAPLLSAPDQDGKAISLGDIYAQGITLVYFYPKADTPGCTSEACSLRDSFADLRARGVHVVGVSEDREDAQKKFQEKYGLPFPLIADHDGAVAKAFGVPTVLGFARRQSFLIRDGKVVWRDLNASTSQQAADVLKALGALPGTSPTPNP